VTPDSDHGPGAPDDDSDLGPPIVELRDVSWPMDERFAARVRGRIERRVFGAGSLELLWTAPLLMLVEFLRWPIALFTDRRK
jgi:hypothetical protein